MKIIHNIKDNTLRQVDFEEKVTYDFTQLKVFILKDIKGSFFIKLSNGNKINLVRLNKIGSNGNYFIYSPSTKGDFINCGNSVNLSLILFRNEATVVTDSFLINLDYESYNWASKISAIAEASSEISEYFEKISEMTKMNMKLYKDIREVSEK